MSLIRFRAQNEPPPRKSIKIAVAIDDKGNWIAYCGPEYDGNTIDDLIGDEHQHLDGDAKAQFWLVVDISLPATEVLANQSGDEE